MKKQIALILILLFPLSSFSSDSKTYIRADYGMGNFESDQLDSLNANLSGSTMGVAFGSKVKYIEFGAFYRKFDLKKEITHDGVTNEILHDGNTFGLDLSVFLNSHLSLKLGYAVNSYSQKFASAMSSTAEAAANSAYGIEGDGNKSSIFYGVNYDIFGGKTWDMYTSVIQFPMGDGKKSLTAQIGIRYYMNKSFSDFIGN